MRVNTWKQCVMLGERANLAHQDRWREGPSMVLQDMRSSRGISVSLRQGITQSTDDPKGDQRDGHRFSRHLHGEMTGGPSTP